MRWLYVQHLTPAGKVGWEGEVLRADPPRVLSYTFHMRISEAHRAESPSRVTFELEPFETVVKLTLTHDQLDLGGPTAATTIHGWPAIISSLKSLLETDRPLPFSRLGFAPGQQQRVVSSGTGQVKEKSHDSG